MLNRVIAFKADARGSVAALFCVFIVIIVVMIGLVIDYSMAMWRRAKVQAAADASVLAVINSVSRTQGREEDIAAAIELGKNIFAANVKETFPSLVSNVTVLNNAGMFEAQVKTDPKSKLYFGRFLGASELNLPIVSSAKAGGTGYLDIYLALDVSDSMGLGASAVDQQALQGLTGCQFACHVDDGSGSVASVAIANGIPMRLDVLKSDAIDLVTSMETSAASSFFRVGLIAFHDRATELLPLTDNFTGAASTINGLSLALGVPRSNPAEEYGMTPDAGDTQPGSLVSLLEDRLPAQGTGTAANPKKFVVIVTDGTVSTWSPFLTTAPWDPAACNELKSRGIEIAVVYLEYSYYGKETDATWPWAIAPIEAQIEPNLKACSSGLFLKANDPAEVHAAFQSVFNKLVQTSGVVLTQ